MKLLKKLFDFGLEYYIYDKQHAQRPDVRTSPDGTTIVPAFMRLAVPEETSDANKNLELLQAVAPPLLTEDLSKIPRTYTGTQTLESGNFLFFH